jgi:hypothetical protein
MQGRWVELRLGPSDGSCTLSFILDHEHYDSVLLPESLQLQSTTGRRRHVFHDDEAGCCSVPGCG